MAARINDFQGLRGPSRIRDGGVDLDLACARRWEYGIIEIDCRSGNDEDRSWEDEV